MRTSTVMERSVWAVWTGARRPVARTALDGERAAVPDPLASVRRGETWQQAHVHDGATRSQQSTSDHIPGADDSGEPEGHRPRRPRTTCAGILPGA